MKRPVVEQSKIQANANEAGIKNRFLKDPGGIETEIIENKTSEI